MCAAAEPQVERRTDPQENQPSRLRDMVGDTTQGVAVVVPKRGVERAQAPSTTERGALWAALAAVAIVLLAIVWRVRRRRRLRRQAEARAAAAPAPGTQYAEPIHYTRSGRFKRP
jgi:hypothetical protein